MASPPLHGQKIMLRPFEPGDADVLQEYLNNPQLFGRRYIPRDFPEDVIFTRKQVDRIIEKWEKTDRRAHFAVLLVGTDTLIGHAGAYWGWDPHCPNIDIVISPDYQHQGHGYTVLCLLVQWIFDSLPAHNISVWIADWNEPALKFFQKHGFSDAGRSRREAMWQGSFVDYVLMDILRFEWEQRL